MRLLDRFLRRDRDEDLQEEIQTHLSMATQDRIAAGEAADSARFDALKEFGNVALVREATRASWGSMWRERVADAARDVRYAVRTLVRSPGYALVVLAVLSLGVGANVALFTLFKVLALTPIPKVAGSARLGVLVARTDSGRIMSLSLPDFRDLRQHGRLLHDFAGTSMDAYSLGLGNHGERVFGEMVTGNYFQLLGVHARLGRTLQPSDDVVPGGHPVVVISDGLWRRVFASDPAIVGKTIQVNAHPFTVVGVTEPGFQGSIVSLRMDLFVPVMMQPQLRGIDLLSAREIPLVWGLGRLDSGVSLDATASEADLLSARLDAERPARSVPQRATVIPMWRSPFGAQTYMLPAVLLLGVMGMLLLLVVCANISNLVLVRAVSRRGEVAARMALGASRVRILRLLFAESLVLAVPAAVVGVLLARGLGLLMRDANIVSNAPVPVGMDMSPDWTVVAFALLLSCGSAAVFGFLPLLRVSRLDLAAVMKDDLSPRGGSRGRMRHVLVIAQVAVSLLLLVGAGLVGRSLESARTANTGFDAHRVASVAVDLTPNGYDAIRGRAFYQRLLEAVRKQPGVESAALTGVLPLTLVDGNSVNTDVEGYVPRNGEDMRFLFNRVSPDYFATLRIGLVAGRDFTRLDRVDAQPVAIVNETMARRFWRTPQGALGQRVSLEEGSTWRTVVGVVRDIKYARVTEDPRPVVYRPFEQSYTPAMTLHVRSAEPERSLIPRMRATIQSLDPNLPILNAGMLTDQIRVALTVFATAANVLLVFGTIAVILTALGTFGLVSYAARQSTHEIGVRIAVGANRGALLRRFLGRGLRLGAAGALCGLVASVLVASLLGSVLYGVSPTDPGSFAGATVIVLATVALASFLPAWRASRIDPIAALRHR
jgi:predicted permease